MVTADHGASFETGVGSRRKVTLGNVDEVGPGAAVREGPGQKARADQRALVRTLDVMPTIADVVNAPIPYSRAGAPHSAARRTRPPLRPHPQPQPESHDQDLAPGVGERRRAIVRRRLSRYGSGDLASLYTGIGPNRCLIGDDLAELEARTRPGASAPSS